MRKGKKVLSSIQKSPYYPIAVKSGKEALLYDYDGNEYIDFLSSASYANIGHGNKELNQAVKNQMDEITQYTIAYFTCEAPVLLAEKIIDLSPYVKITIYYS